MNHSIIREGFLFLGIESREDKLEVFDALYDTAAQERWQEELRLRKEFDERFLIPVNMSKKFYQELLKKTREKINELKVHARYCLDCWLPERESENFEEKRDKLKALTTNNATEKADVTKAKAYPIDMLIQFKGGFAKCLVDTDERTGSMKFNKKTNTVYCFGCSQKWDAIDVYSKINHVTFTEAVKALTCA